MNVLRTVWDFYRLRQNESKSRRGMLAMQQEELRKMLRYAYENSPYYRNAFEQKGITEENLDNVPLSEFPSIDKTALLEHFGEIVTVRELQDDDIQEKLQKFDESEKEQGTLFRGKYHIVHSSGSTGKPGDFIYDGQAWNRMLSGIIRGALWGLSVTQIGKLLLKKPRILYIAATDGRYGGAMAVGDGIDGLGAGRMYLDIKTPLAEWTYRVRSFTPDIIIGYPSAVKILAELVEQEGVKLNICRIVSCGEPLGNGLRQYLESVFHTGVINFYGASESLALGVEQYPEEGMLLFDDLNVIEAGDDGVYLTCLYNFAQPLIRYQISDSLILKEADENGRYPFTKAEGLLGRNEDILWFEDGSGRREFLHPLAIEGICIEGLHDYQFRKLSEDAFEMKAQVADYGIREEIKEEILGYMRKILMEKGLGYVQFYVSFVDEIRTDFYTGKKRLVVV